ncbi:MAG: U32 family peptidase [Oscillospiraceae bacterium]|nr:U32 family peptidase [Oscillospiraceae bacterium]
MKLELLSPCGDMESLKAAILYGADAVYVGGEAFGLRANAGFTIAELSEAVDYAHERSVKVYLTCNIVADNSDIDRFTGFIKQLPPVDAVIVSDMGIFDILRTQLPEMPVHVSTQAGVMNYAAANMLYKLGARRIVLARETSLTDIKKIRESIPHELELEVFVHGAMCVSYSGRCLLSSYMTNRDANKGICSHPCRWSYHLMEESRPGEFFKIYEDDENTFILNSKDLCMIGYINELSTSGVTALKIEGRAKTAYYTATITNAYRAAITAFRNGEKLPDWVRREVDCVSHRQYSTGFYFGDAEQYHKDSGYIRNCDFIGTVDGYSDNLLEITVRNYFTVDDHIEIVQPGLPPQKLMISEMYNSTGEAVKIANHAMEKMKILCSDVYKTGSMLRRVNV